MIRRVVNYFLTKIIFDFTHVDVDSNKIYEDDDIHEQCDVACLLSNDWFIVYLIIISIISYHKSSPPSYHHHHHHHHHHHFDHSVPFTHSSSSSLLQPSALGSTSHSVNALNLSPPGKATAFVLKNVNFPNGTYMFTIIIMMMMIKMLVVVVVIMKMVMMMMMTYGDDDSDNDEK